jgi:uncharacterized protein with HEPN domain
MSFTYDQELVADILSGIIWSLDQISKRFQGIKSSDDFIKDDFGLEKLDSICMQLINTGEALKQLDKLTDAQLLAKYPEIDWKKAKGMRDIITHHYFDLDAETVFSVCAEHVPAMKEVIIRIANNLKE